MNFSISATNAVILAHIGARLETPEGLPEAQVLHITALEDYGEHLSLERDRREFNANPQGSSLKIYTDPSKIDPSIKPALKTWSFVYGGCRMGKVSVLDMYPVNLFHKWSLWLIGCKLARPMTFGRALKVLRTEYTNNLKIKNALDRAAANLKKGEALDIRFSGEIAPAYAPQYVNNAQALEYAIKRLAAKLPTFDHNAEPINTESKFSLELIEESSFASKTAHFDESENSTGFARVTLDGRDVGRVRTWSVDEATESNARDALYRAISSFNLKTRVSVVKLGLRL